MRPLLVVAVVAVSSTAAAATEERSALVEHLLASDADAVIFEPPRAGASTVRLGARVAATVERLRAVLIDPAAYRRAIPAFVRAEPLRGERGAAGAAADRLLAWELEIPLWNLQGTLWMRPRPDGVELELAEGDMIPGRLRLRALAGSTPGETLLLVEGAVNMRNANWVTRRLAARDPLAEPAMTVTAAFVLLRALSLEAAGGREAIRWPRSAMRAPAADRLDARTLATRMAAAPGAAGRALAVVRSRADGRLESVSVALGSRLSAADLESRIAEVGRWRALPGWKSVRALPADRSRPLVWEVDSSFPFVDFDAEWTVRSLRPFRGSADGGDWRGPVMGWDVAAGATGGAGAGGATSAAAYTLHPRLERTGYLPRKLIEAEPLLEHGLALGLAYVNAVSLLRALER